VSFSPDGERLAAIREGIYLDVIDARDGALLHRFHIASITGWDDSDLVYTDMYAVRWSPDGERIAFARDMSAYVIDIDTSVVTALTAPTACASWPASWAPDGSELLFAQNAVFEGTDCSHFGRLSTDGRAGHSTPKERRLTRSVSRSAAASTTSRTATATRFRTPRRRHSTPIPRSATAMATDCWTGRSWDASRSTARRNRDGPRPDEQ
jgi:dipeptidyl aminopeptidase/acylaminoacyl peptidase